MTEPGEGVRSQGYILAGLASLDLKLLSLAEVKAVFFAGLPGTGKSLFVHQLAHLAHQRGRTTRLLQWDIARPVFEASPAGQRYPLVDGVTHVVIRRAVGLWARAAVLEWWQAHRGDSGLLLGEVPLVGNRLTELVTPAADAAEDFLASPACVFVLPVPSNEVRRHIEAERRRRFQSPLHEREREDASPDVMRATWLDLLVTARDLALVSDDSGEVPYSSEVYRAVYERLLRQRHSRVIQVDALLPTSAMSVYDYPPGCRFVVPPQEDTEPWIRLAEANFGL